MKEEKNISEEIDTVRIDWETENKKWSSAYILSFFRGFERRKWRLHGRIQEENSMKENVSEEIDAVKM